MSEHQTPGRRAQARSALADHDLAARLGRLPIPREAIPRLVAFVVEEIEQATARARRESFSSADLTAAGADDELLTRAREARQRRTQAEALQSAGLGTLDQDELQRVLELARQQGS